MVRIPKRVEAAFRVLLENIGGTGNSRYEAALTAALVSAPVQEALENAIEHFLKHDEDRKNVIRRLDRAEPVGRKENEE